MTYITGNLAVENEQYYLGCLILEGELIDEVRLKPRAFSTPEHKIIIQAMLDLRKKEIGIELPTIVNEIVDSNKFETFKRYKERPIEYMTELAGAIPTTRNFKFYESQIIEQWKVEQARRHSLKYTENPTGETLKELTEQLNKIEGLGGKEQVQSNKDVLVDIYEELSQPKTGEVTGVDTGYSDYNRMTEGLHGNEFTIVGARPSVGKTAFTINLAENILTIDPKTHVIVYSLEMTRKQLLIRMAGMIARVPLHKIKGRNLSSEEWQKITMALGELENRNIHIIDDMGMTVQDMRAETRKLMKEYPDGEFVVMVDYLQIIKYDGKADNRNHQLGEIGNGLKAIAKNFNIPVVCLAQLSRGVESRQDKRPSMSDLRDSGEIEQIADVIILLYRDDYYDAESESKNILELIFDKQRDGATGTIELAFLREYGLILNLDRRYNAS